MATNNTSSPTPSEDNRQNIRDDIMYSALDKVMKNSEQGYEDFLNSFTYLKQGLKGKQDQNEKTKKMTAVLKKSVPVSVGLQKEKQCVDSQEILEANMQDLSVRSDDIDEEILYEGDSTSRMTEIKLINTGSLVKFDNFVDPVDDVEDLADVSDEGYTASFSEGKFDVGVSKTSTGVARKSSRDEKDACSSDRLQENSVATNAEVSDIRDSQLSLDETATDKLLMNFLADLQNELNEGKTNDGPRSEATDSPMDIQMFLDKSKKQKEQVSEVNFDDDDENDAISLLYDDSEKSDIKVKITEEEFNKVMKSDVSEEEKRVRLGNIYRESLMDSEGKIRPLQSERTGAEPKAVNADIDVDSVIFPGQVEETNDLPVNENDTLLDFKATYKEITEKTDAQMEMTGDLIQPFQLDEDFDYDNVVLAPKFSSQDLHQLKTNIKPQTVVM